jgi:hypothetical protein
VNALSVDGNDTNVGPNKVGKRAENRSCNGESLFQRSNQNAVEATLPMETLETIKASNNAFPDGGVVEE